MDKTWKREERQVAKAFNATRALMKGTREKSDVVHDMFLRGCEAKTTLGRGEVV